jgi:hypothetical protein
MRPHPPHHIPLVQVAERHSLDPRENALDLDEARLLPTRQVDLRLVTTQHRPRVQSEAGEEHLHLSPAHVLRLVENHERVLQGAPTHVSQGRDLDRARLQRPLDAVVRHHVLERVVQRTQVGIHLRLEIPG